MCCFCLAIYETANPYKMDSEPRGLCLIVNMTHFDKGEIHLTPRIGADKDVGQWFFPTFCRVVSTEILSNLMLLSVQIIVNDNVTWAARCSGSFTLPSYRKSSLNTASPSMDSLTTHNSAKCCGLALDNISPSLAKQIRMSLVAPQSGTLLASVSVWNFGVYRRAADVRRALSSFLSSVYIKFSTSDKSAGLSTRHRH